MSGHSHWAGIKYKKATADARRGKLFSKLTKAVMIAARNGSDPETNVRLRHAIEKAKQASVPRDNIERAVKKGAGELEGESLTEATYEGYGPGGVALLIQALSDNLNRTTPEVRRIFESKGGKFGSSGATAWMFTRKGLFSVPKEAVEEDALLEAVLEAGVDDVNTAGASWEIICPAEDFDSVRTALAGADLAPTLAELIFIADPEMEPDLETQRKNLALMEALEEHDDVQNVFAAFTPSDEVLAELEGKS